MIANDEKADRLASELRAAFALCLRAVFDCLRYPRSLLRVVRLPGRGPGLSASEVEALRALLGKGGHA